MAQTFVHRGSRESILPSASPGLVFLKFVLPALDALGPFRGTPELARFLAPNATFTMNNEPAVEASRVLRMLGMRSRGLSSFSHDLETAWDIANADGSRTVMFKSTSVTVFTADEQGVEVRIKEFNIMELIPSKVGRGCNGLQALRLMTYLDPAPVSARAEAMQKQQQATPGEAGF